MNLFAELAAEKAFSPNDDLWILTESSSTVFQRLNWLMNFQLTGALEHKTPALSPRLEKILKDCTLGSLDFIEDQPDPVWLIGSLSYLPCRWVMLAPFAGEQTGRKLPDWWSGIRQRIEALKATNVRIFTALDPHQLGLSSDIRYTVVRIPTQGDPLLWT